MAATQKNSAISDPVRFAQEILGVKLWSVQKEILRAFADHRRIAIKACHASSKTHSAAIAALWWCARYRDGKVLITSPSYTQQKGVLWVEIHKMLRGAAFSFPMLAENQTELKLGPDNFILGLSTNTAERFQGFHSGHTAILCDESPGIPPYIFEAIEGIASGGDTRILLLGNPTIASGPFYDAFTRGRDAWHCISISAFDTPNLKGVTLDNLLSMSDRELAANPWPMLCTRDWVRAKYSSWFNGQAENSPLWQSRILGEFPSESEDTLISLSWLEAARAQVIDDGGPVTVGIDPAGAGDDETAVIVLGGNGAILEQKASTARNAWGMAVELLNRWRHRLSSVYVDEVGVGFGLIRQLEAENYPVTGINVGRASSEPERFFNSKAQRYWSLRERFKAGKITGVDDELIAQSGAIRYSLDGKGRIVIESKEQLKSRGVRSPDRCEALLLACGDPSVESFAGVLEWQKQQMETIRREQELSSNRTCYVCSGPIRDNFDPYIRVPESSFTGVGRSHIRHATCNEVN
jgi:phage terminase large subunit